MTDYLIRLSPQGVCDRLRKHTDREFMGFSPGERQVVGSVKYDSFMLRVRTGYGNAFASYLRGRYGSVPGGTRISIRSAFHPWAQGILFVAPVVILGGVIFGWRGAPNLSYRLLGAVGALAALFLVYGMGRILSGNDRRTLEEFLERLFADVRAK